MDRKFHLKQFGFSTAAGIALILAACGKTEETNTARPLRVGYQQGGSSTLPMIAREYRYFDQTGVKTDFTVFTSSSDGLNAAECGKA